MGDTRHRESSHLSSHSSSEHRADESSRPRRAACGLVIALLAGLGACRESPRDGALPPAEPAPSPPAADLSGKLPVTGHHLDRSIFSNAGLLTHLAPDGTPVRLSDAQGESQPDDIDPLVIEARRFYDTLGSPSPEPQALDYPDPFTGDPPGLRRSAPTTLALWKETFGFYGRRQDDESLEQYRQRLDIAVYYNRNELGLGRELGCADFVDGEDATGAPLMGLACFVTNYGSIFRDEAHALALALQGATPRNTVCITHRPSMPPGYQVQFYTYGADGRRNEWAQLDTLGPRPHPQVCINCHGGSYDADKHLARDARFLPLDPNVVAFSRDPASRRTRAAQEESIRRINAASLRTPLTSAQREMLAQLYRGGVQTPGVVSAAAWTPVGWSATRADRDLYDKVVKPYCATCHLGLEQGLGGPVSASHRFFDSSAAFLGFPMSTVVCGNFSMPNAQPTILALWDSNRGPITIADKSYPSAADALLGAFKLDRNQCVGLASVGSCNRGSDPDALCGTSNSGMACNRATGRCVPEFTANAPDLAHGFCRLDGSRSCPATLVCRAMATTITGLETFDGACVTP
jgi:hypothetical protein